jgi:hypothetical protein
MGMMSEALVGTIGALFGLIVVAFGNIAVLPWVLRRQKERFNSGWKDPIFGWDQEAVARITKFGYRFVMPILFAFVGFQSGAKFVGAH